MNNGGKPSRICLLKHLESVTEVPRLGFSSRKQFFSPKTAKIRHQGDPGPLEQPLQPIYRKKGEEVAAQLAQPGLLPPEAIQLRKYSGRSNFKISKLLFAPPHF